MAISGFQMLFQSNWLGSGGVMSGDSNLDKAAGCFSLEQAQGVFILILLYQF
jgi:hypothetical protein